MKKLIFAAITTLIWLGFGNNSVNGATTTASSITKDGITWTFSQPVTVGQFVTGDYYVVGNVTVTNISPQPTTSAPYRNGSVKNLPNLEFKCGFDNRINDGGDESFMFNANLRVYAPLNLSPGDSLVSSISMGEAEYKTTRDFFGASNQMAFSSVKTVSILTVLSAPVSDDAFRPSYCDRAQTIYHANNLNRNLLPSLAPPNATIAGAMTSMLSLFESRFRRPWIDLTPFTFDAPIEYMPDYSQYIALADSYVGLLLSLNYPSADKVNLTNYFVQYGIDLYGALKAGKKWTAIGGHGLGRKMPIIFAGLLLNDSGMKNISRDYPDSFGEDMQTVYVNQIPGGYTQAWQGATVIYGGHEGVLSNGQPAHPTDFTGSAGPYEQLPPSQWPICSANDCGRAEQLGEIYRRCCTSTSWIGQSLSMRLLNGQGTWNHDAFFDYTDRWMSEDDTQAVAAILAQSGNDYGSAYLRQGQTKEFLRGRIDQYTFIDDMWWAYRNNGPATKTLVVSKNGSGTVAGNGIDCGPTCSQTYQTDTSATLTATPANGYSFSSWNGCNSVSGNTCSVSVTGFVQVTATFSLAVSSGSQVNVTVDTPLVFSITDPGTYELIGSVNASTDSANSFYVDIDANPRGDESRTWDLAITSGYRDEYVSWRGANAATCYASDCAQFNPKDFGLTTGAHTLYIDSREIGTLIQSITFVKVSNTIPTPPPASPTPSITPSPTPTVSPTPTQGASPTPTPTPTVNPTPTGSSEGFLPTKNVFNPAKEPVSISYAVLDRTIIDAALSVYDRQGAKIKDLGAGTLVGTTATTTWDGKNSDGQIVAAGTYIVILKKGDKTFKKKVVVIK